MHGYIAPLQNIQFSLSVCSNLAGDRTAEIPKSDMFEDLLLQAAKLAERDFAPLSRKGDIVGAKIIEGRVRFPDGYREAYEKYLQGGWHLLQFKEKDGGEQFPFVLTSAISELWNSADLVMGQFFMPLGGSVDVLRNFGETWLREICIPPLVAGRWAATLCMTEPQAGSDLDLLRCSALKDGDNYRLRGQKSLISLADHDLTENILLFTLARTPHAAKGTKGLSLFVVPTRRVARDGQCLGPNDVKYLSLESKLGLNGIPTGPLQLGEQDGAIGYLVGEESRGLQCIFTLLNRTRVAIGLLALGNAERAYQLAATYAKLRIQGRNLSDNRRESVAIVYHPDVRRMLMSMKARIDCVRHMCFYTAALIDRKDDAAATQRAQLLTPILKCFAGQQAFEVASIAVQVHGGAGYIEDGGSAQMLRDARVHTLYEGTTGIQAIDLVIRKVKADDGATMFSFLEDAKATVRALSNEDSLSEIRDALARCVDELNQATKWVLKQQSPDLTPVLASSVPYLELVSLTVASWLMGEAALHASERRQFDDHFSEEKIILARFFATHLAVNSSGLLKTVKSGSGPTMELDPGRY